MKTLIIGITAAIMLAGASVYAANKVNGNKSKTTTCCCGQDCSCSACSCGASCSK